MTKEYKYEIMCKMDYDHVKKYLEMYPYMEDEEAPMCFDEFCEFIIQQNAKQADVYFKEYPEIAEQFLTYFKPTNGRVFHRGGFENLDRTFLSASLCPKVAKNFAIYGHNFEMESEKVGNVFTITSELYYKTKAEVENEREVFLWKPRILTKSKIS